MAITINTTSAQYQQYLTGLGNVRDDLAPLLRRFEGLTKEQQIAWLRRDPLLRRLVKLAWFVSKHVPIDTLIDEVRND